MLHDQIKVAELLLIKGAKVNTLMSRNILHWSKPCAGKFLKRFKGVRRPLPPSFIPIK